MKINAIVFGATGMVGEGVLHEALNHPNVESVLVIGRRSCNVKHQKLKELVHNDFFDYSAIQNQLKGYNACYFCLGVTSIGKDEKEYTHLTYDLTMQAANALSRLNTEMTFCYVSGAGTDSTEKGRSMWARVKGKTENDVMKLPFKSAYAFRPGFIKPTKGLKNAFTAAKVMGTLYPVLKVLFRKYVCTLEDLGLAMINVTDMGFAKKVLECEDIARVASAVAGGNVYRSKSSGLIELGVNPMQTLEEISVTEPDNPYQKFQWKWVWISLLMYIVLYFIPLALIPGGILNNAVVSKASAMFIGLWSFAGIIVIAAIAGFISEGVTIKEPVVAAIGVMVLWIVAVQVRFNSAFHFTVESTLALFSALAVVGLLSLGGAWLGERVQDVFKTDGSE
jgi:NAD dependent epimerase/dehydratase family